MARVARDVEKIWETELIRWRQQSSQKEAVESVVGVLLIRSNSIMMILSNYCMLFIHDIGGGSGDAAAQLFGLDNIIQLFAKRVKQ